VGGETLGVDEEMECGGGGCDGGEDANAGMAYFEDFEVRPAEVPVEETCYSWHVYWC